MLSSEKHSISNEIRDSSEGDSPHPWKRHFLFHLEQNILIKCINVVEENEHSPFSLIRILERFFFFKIKVSACRFFHISDIMMSFLVTSPENGHYAFTLLQLLIKPCKLHNIRMQKLWSHCRRSQKTWHVGLLIRTFGGTRKGWKFHLVGKIFQNFLCFHFEVATKWIIRCCGPYESIFSVPTYH